MKKIKRIKNEEKSSLKNTETLLQLAREVVTQTHEVFDNFTGIDGRDEFVKLEMKFPPPELDKKDPNLIRKSSVHFQITSGGVTVKSTMHFSDLIQTEQTEEVGKNN